MSIHPTALVDGRASIGRNVSIGAFTIVHGNVEIGDDTVIESHCEIGHPAACSDGTALRIGERSLIRSHTVMYEGSSFGAELVTGHQSVFRDGTRAGVNLITGIRADVQGDCTIGDYTRFQSDVLVGKGSTIGNFCWLLPTIRLLNDPVPPSHICVGPTIGDYAVLCANVTVLPGVSIGEGAFIGAVSKVAKDVAAHRLAYGNPCIDKGLTSRLRLPGGELARPWTEHFHRGYPEEVVQMWANSVHLAA